jgi:hypothetical protein
MAMSNTRVIRRPVAAKSASEKSSGGKAKWIVAILLLLMMAGIAYAFIPRSDPALAKIEEIRGQMEGANDQQRRELWGQMRKEMENLTPEARDQMREEWGQRWQAREQEELNKFFDLTPAEQIKEIDEDLKREASRRKERAQRGNRGGGERADRGGGRGPRGGRDNSGDPNARSKRYLDSTTPQSRAMRGEYRRMREERRQQIGL